MASFQDLPRKASEIRAGELFGFKPSVLTCAILSIYSLFCVGCGSQESKIDEPSSSLSGSGLKTNRYTIKGVVRSIDRESHSVVIHHEAVPNFMPEMTMPFKVSGEILDDLEPGDEVQGTLEVGAEQSRLTDLFITRPAEAPVSPSSHSPSTNLLSVGEPVPNFQITTQEGGTANLSDWKGHFVALTFIYTRCPLPDFCPMLDRKFSELSRLLKRQGDQAPDIRLLSISFDPEYDTPKRLSEHAQRLGARLPRWTFAVASHQELSRVGAKLGLEYGARKDEIIHTLTTVLISPEGTLVAILRGNDWSAADVLDQITPVAQGH